MSRQNAKIQTLPFPIEIGKWYNYNPGKRKGLKDGAQVDARFKATGGDAIKGANVKGSDPNDHGGKERYFHKDLLLEAQNPGLSADQSDPPEVITETPVVTEAIEPATDETAEVLVLNTNGPEADAEAEVLVLNTNGPEVEAEIEADEKIAAVG